MAQRLTLFPERTIQMAAATKKTAAIALAAGLAFTGSAGIAAQDAVAQTRVSGPATATVVPEAPTIPAGDNFTLTVNKRINPTELRNGTGQQDAVAGVALEGVEFTVQKLQGDIRTQKDFNALAKLSEEYNKAAEKPDVSPDSNFAARKITTGANGAAEFGGLPAGAYLVTETNTQGAKPVGDPAPAGKNTDTFVAADPFIVFVPMTNPEGDGWISNVHVYPKNSFVRVEKSVVDADKHANVASAEGETNNRKSDIQYTLTGRVPSAAEGKTLTGLNLRDSYNSSELTFQMDPAQNGYFVQSVVVMGTAGAKKADLVRETDYRVETDGVAYNPEVTGANAAFRISLTEEGLKKVAPNDKVVATVQATMENATDKEIVNGVDEHGTITRNPDGATTFEPEPFDTPKDEVVTYLGDIEVFKTGEKNGTRTALAGATFEIGKCNTGANGFNGGVIASGTTNADGKLRFEGLHVTDVINGEAVDAPGKYCLRETAAPAGYTFDKNKFHAIELKKETKMGVQPADFLKATDTQVANYAEGGEVIRMNGVAVNNIERNVPTLPATGGMGVLIVVLAGLAIIGGGVYAARRNAA